MTFVPYMYPQLLNLSVFQDVVRNEIQVMNQLSHANLIQLYAAFESRHDIVLVME